LVPDGHAPGIGRLTVDGHEVEVVRREEISFLNEDGEEIVIRDAIVVLSVVAIDPGV
jgi:hypothetical protein